MITWANIIVEACKELQIEDKIEASNEKLQNTVSIKAGEAKKKHEPYIQARIGRVIWQEQDYFEKTGRGVYRLKRGSYNKAIKKEWEEENKQLLSLEKQLEGLKELSEFERWAIIKQRIGQGAFRKTMLQKWGGCSVTGYEQSEILIASHIKPWSKSIGKEKTDENNGLLLVANLDKAFDQGLITFKDDGSILISDALENPEAIGITQHTKLREIFEENKKHLKYHRDEVFEKQVTLDKENDIESDDNK